MQVFLFNCAYLSIVESVEKATQEVVALVVM